MTWVRADCECCGGKGAAWIVAGSARPQGRNQNTAVRCDRCRMVCNHAGVECQALRKALKGTAG